MLPNHVLLVLMAIAFSAAAAFDVPNCSISAEALKAQNNTCIDLSLCPAAGANQICPLIYFPVCGKNASDFKIDVIKMW